MCLTSSILRFLVHAQIVMACSAVCYVGMAQIFLSGAFEVGFWWPAAFLGTLGLYLLDSVRSADREDAISQPMRAAWFRRRRGLATVGSLLSLALALAFVLLAAPSREGWWMLLLLALLGGAYLLPLVPRRRGWSTLKSFSHAKPVTISLAWFVGALLVAWESTDSTSTALQVGSSLLFALSTVPLLLLDSIWLDRRDRHADLAFSQPTLSSSMGGGRFQCLRILLWCTPLLVPILAPDLWITVLGFQVGGLVLVVIEPDRIRSEAIQVIVASGWRFSGFAAGVISLG